MTKRFDEFIKSQAKNTEKNSTAQITPEQEKKLWLEKLAELHNLVDESLNAYVKSGDVKITRVPVVLHEEQLGLYEANQLEILLGRQLIRLKPIGTFLIGARGRVDMTGPRGIVRFVIVPPALEKPSFRVTVSIGGKENTPTPEPKYVPPEEWVWKISTLPPRIMYLELTSESFREALIEVVNGDV
ncbi:hypothetical protein [Castellaniella sp.]|uniref:hypothetical protein n=1 Tax=Castellaniella sp. TaxID=1955812 RepID=UPI003C73C9F1